MKGKKILLVLVCVLTLCLALVGCNLEKAPKFEPKAIETIATTYTNGQDVQAEGVVYGVTGNGFYLSDSENGHLFVVIGSEFKKDVAVGDKVQVTGKFSYAKNIIQINAVSKYEKVSSGNASLVKATETTIPAVNALSNEDKTVYGRVVTLVGNLSKSSTNLYCLTDMDGKAVFFDSNSNEAALEAMSGKRVTLNAVMYKYLVSDNVWTLSFVGTESDITEKPLSFSELKAMAVEHINENLATKVYGRIELPTAHDTIPTLTYTWSVEANEYITITDNEATIVTDSVDHEVTLKATITSGETSETVDFPVTLKGIVEQTVSEFYKNLPTVDDSYVIVRGIVVSVARNQSLSTRSFIIKDPVTNETLPIDFSDSGDYILNTSAEYKAVKAGDEIVVTAEYSFSGRPTIQHVSKLEVKSSGNAVSHDFENAYVLKDKASYEYLANHVYDYSGKLVKLENPFLNYSTSATPNDTNWVILGYDETSGPLGYKASDNTTRKFAFLIAAVNENLGHNLWHKYYELPFLNAPAQQYGLEIYAYCLYVSDSYVAFIVPDQSAFKFAAKDQIVIDLAAKVPASIECESVSSIELPTEHALATGAITWTSSNNEVINAETGAVAEVKANTVVTLTATYVVNGETLTYSKDVTVLASLPISVTDLHANGLADSKYKVSGVIVAFASDGNSAEGVKGVLLMDPATNEIVLVNGLGALTNTKYPAYTDQAGKALAIGMALEVKGVYNTELNSLNVAEGKVAAGEATEVVFDDAKVTVIDSPAALEAFVTGGDILGKVIKFVGTTEAPIYFGGSSSSSPMNVKVFMNNAKTNDETKVGGKTFALKTDVNAANGGDGWHQKYLALPEAFVAPNHSKGQYAHEVSGAIYAVVSHITGSYYQMALVNLDGWTAQPALEKVKEQIVDGLGNAIDGQEFNIELPASTHLAGAITWTSGSELINLETKAVAKVNENTEVTLTGTFTYGGETQTVEHVVTIMAGAPTKVSEAKLAEEGAVLYMEALVLGFGGNGSKNEIILMDTETEEFIGLQSTETVARGDLIRFTAKVAISTNETEAGKKLLVEAEGIEVISQGNDVSLDLTKAIAITSQEELSKVHEGTEYVLYKLEGKIFVNMYKSSSDNFSKVYFRLHMNPDCKELADLRYQNEAGTSISAGFRNNYIAKNLGDDWADKAFGITEYKASLYPGVEFNGTIYAMYVGGNGYYQQFTIFESSHIIKAQ